mgnify:CR=1 FL=1
MILNGRITAQSLNLLSGTLLRYQVWGATSGSANRLISRSGGGADSRVGNGNDVGIALVSVEQDGELNVSWISKCTILPWIGNFTDHLFIEVRQV